MRSPSTGDRLQPPASSGEAKADGTRGGGDTRSTVDGEPAPRLPHERDESSDTEAAKPGDVSAQAAADAASGKTTTDRGEATDELYARTLRGPTPGAGPDRH